MPSIDIQHLSKRFGDTEVIRDVSFKAVAGDIVAIIGPSGCGKTTLLRCVLGELRPDGGRILIDGEDVTHTPVEKRGVGIVYQSYALFPHMTVADNVAYGLRLRKASPSQIRDRVREMLELVRLDGKNDQYPHRLSGGERQRVALARALAVEPRALLLDEAFAALDATTRTQVVQEVRSIIRRLKLTTLLITHDQEEAFLFSRHVVVLNQGQVVVAGEPEHVMAYPHPFIRNFVKVALFHSAKVEQDPHGSQYVTLADGQRIPIDVPGIVAGDEVHVMVKKGTRSESIEVWKGDRF